MLRPPKRARKASWPAASALVPGDRAAAFTAPPSPRLGLGALQPRLLRSLRVPRSSTHLPNSDLIRAQMGDFHYRSRERTREVYKELHRGYSNKARQLEFTVLADLVLFATFPLRGNKFWLSVGTIFVAVLPLFYCWTGLQTVYNCYSQTVLKAEANESFETVLDAIEGDPAQTARNSTTLYTRPPCVEAWARPTPTV